MDTLAGMDRPVDLLLCLVKCKYQDVLDGNSSHL
jgi:hypothetical protein